MSLDQTKIPNLYKERTQLDNGVWCLPDYSKDWGGEVNRNFELLDSLLDRKTLKNKSFLNNITLFNFLMNDEKLSKIKSCLI